jgi:UDP-N-acetyl-D-mannosaminuronic acid transferase (WecB/TagA/CpsF family)
MPQPAERLVSTKRVLGIDFFHGTANEVMAYVCRHGGMVVAPGAPSMVALQDDPDYRRAILDADVAIADSGWMVLFWKLLRGEQLTRISGLAFFKALLASADAREPRYLFWVLPSETAKLKTIGFAQNAEYPTTEDDCYVAPDYKGSSHGSVTYGAAKREYEPTYPVTDPDLLAIIQRRRPKHIIIAIGGGTQDKLGSYLKRHLLYDPGIYCIGAAPGFITGDQVAIPSWADRASLGWLFRLFAQPRTFVPRLWKARRLPFLILRYGREMPPLNN